MRNILLTTEYDGTNFSGWQRQPQCRTVQGELEKALSKVCGTPVTIDGTSRTDAGVHALGQCASFHGEFGIPTERIMLAVNNLLSGGQHTVGATADVRITSVTEKALDFHARFAAKGKTYLYRIRNAQQQDVFKRNYTYQIAKPLHVKAMKEGASYMIGTQDFKCFQAAGGKELLSTVRTITDITITESNEQEGINHITIAVTGDGFLYNMVRIITGTLVEIGQGKIAPCAVTEMIKSRNRQKAGHTAPAQGLYLARVYYDKTEMEERKYEDQGII